VKSDYRLTAVMVTKGSMTAAQVVVELDLLLPSYKGSWIVEEKGQNMFTTMFPSSDELHRMVLWGPVVAKNVEATMEIEETMDKNIYRYEIPKAWVQFRGLPKELMEFPVIWAVVSMLGATQMVDMKFTKEHNVARFKVAVLDPDLIPNLVDVLIGDYVYELPFRVEFEGEENNPMPIDMDIDPTGHGGEDNGDNLEGGDGKENTGGKDRNASSNSKMDTTQAGNSQTGTGQKIHKQNTTETIKPVVASSPTGPNESLLAEPLMAGVDDFGKKSQQQSKPKNVPANPYATPTRSSKRSAATTDVDSVEKASKLKAKKNLDVPQNKGNGISFTLLDESIVLSNISNVGISISSSVNVSSFVSDLKAAELSRLKESVNKNKVILNDSEEILENVEEFDPIALETLCGNLVEGVSDVDCELELALLLTSHRKKISFKQEEKKDKKVKNTV